MHRPILALIIAALIAAGAAVSTVEACGGQPCPTPAPKCGYAVGYNPPCQTPTATATRTPAATSTPKATATRQPTATSTPKVTPTQSPGGGGQTQEDDPPPAATLPPPPTPTATPSGSTVPPVSLIVPTPAATPPPVQVIVTPPKATPPVVAGPPKAGTGFTEPDNRVLMIGFALIAFAGLVIAVGNLMRGDE